MSTIISYKGKDIANFTDETRVLTTRGKYLEANIYVTDNSSTIILQDKTVDPTNEVQTIVADEDYGGLGTVVVNPIPKNYGLVSYNGAIITIS